MLNNLEDLLKKGDLKTNYRRLAKKYHPDNQETGDARKFRAVQEAYEKVKDNKKNPTYQNPTYQKYEDLKNKWREYVSLHKKYEEYLKEKEEYLNRRRKAAKYSSAIVLGGTILSVIMLKIFK